MSSKLRKPIIRILVVISAFLTILLSVVVGAAIFLHPKPAMPDTSDWTTGMVFFSVGDSWESVVVRSVTGIFNKTVSESTPSHCGIVIMGENGPLLIHSSTIEGHVVVETPDEYIKKNGSYHLYVKSQPFPLDISKLKSDIDSLLSIPVPFDFEFNHSDSKSLYCTELVVILHELNGCNSFSSLREKNFIYPQDILNILSKN